jgi:hypothetical protein
VLNLQVAQPSVTDSLVRIYWPLGTSDHAACPTCLCSGENVHRPVLYVICTHFDEAHPLALPLVDVGGIRRKKGLSIHVALVLVPGGLHAADFAD